MKSSSLFIAALGLVLAAGAHAYHPLVTDDAETLDSGTWQLEAGTDWSRDDSGGGRTREHGYGLALSYGATGELDVAVALVRCAVRGERNADGFGDGEIGMKWRFLRRSGLSLALGSSLTLPTGGDGFSDGRPGAGLRLIATAAPDDAWRLHATLALRYVDPQTGADEPAPRSTRWRASVAVDRGLGERWRLAAEAGAAQAEHRAERDPAFAALGVVYGVRDGLDLSAGWRFALDDAETDAAVVLGVTVGW